MIDDQSTEFTGGTPRARGNLSNLGDRLMDAAGADGDRLDAAGDAGRGTIHLQMLAGK